MKYSFVLLFSIFSFTCANSPFDQHQSSYDPDSELDRLWRERCKKTEELNDITQDSEEKEVMSDEILVAKQKPLDPEFADLVINMSSEATRKLAKIIQECSKDPNEKCPSKILLIGAPGIGKTAYIQAVAEKSNLQFVKINSAFVSNEYKDSGPKNLKAIFKNVLKSKKKIIVAFDELQCLTDGHKNINNPNQNTAEALWLLIDKCLENPNIILVGIMNNGSNMPEPLKSRFEEYVYVMKATDEVAQIQQILVYYLKKYKYDCDEKCQQYIARLLKTSQARSIEGTVERAYWDASTAEDRKITQKNLETVINLSNENKKELKKNEPDQATKTLIAQEREANSANIRNYAVIGATAGTGVAYVVEKNGGWAKVWEKTQGACVHLGKVALVITKHTLKAGAEYCMHGKIPNPKEIIQDMAKDKILEKVKVPSDKDQT